MKKHLLYLLLLIGISAFAQSDHQNWTKTTVYRQATQTPIANPTVAQATQQVSYFDGLGRPVQIISHQQSATGKDIVQHIAYDVYGRQTKEYLPITTGTTSLAYQNIDATSVAAYYDGTHGYDATTNPYTEKLLEASPLGRVQKQAAVGNAWAMGGGHEIKFAYQTNTIAEVKLFSMTTNYNAATNIYKPTLSQQATNYPINHLYKNITIDENNAENTHNQTEEFTNKLGQVVLKRIKTNKNGQQETFDTYYIYDIYGNLTYVLPPIVGADQAITQVVLDGTSYQYQYDHRNRMVAKKIPGKQWEYIVYDKLDRIRATGPAKSPFADTDGIGWLYTKYDKLNRPILTAWQEAQVNENTRSALEKTINAVTTTNSALPVYDLTLSDTRDTQLATVNNVSFNYDNLSYPTANYHVLTINYYDDYNYLDSPTDFSQVLTQGLRDGANGNTKGLSTGSWVRILENSTDTNANTSYTLYKQDRLASPIKTGINYPNGGYSTTKTTVDFEGKVLHSETSHKRDVNAAVVQTEENYTYTPQGKLLKNTHKVATNDTENLIRNEYKELGALKTKHVGGTTSTALQKVDYNYNIRGWLTDINNVADLEDNVFDLFAFSIRYAGLYNGNISKTSWRSSADNLKRSYEYSYDKLNRLTQAHYVNEDLGIYNTYNEALSYDNNGNITNLQRFGGFEGYTGATMIDNLTYSYDPSSPNQLLKVVDLTNSTQGFKDDVTAILVTDDTSDDYAYDTQGNMIKDENKDIINISYNHLNLPTEIQFTNNRKIVYTYDAIGVKLKKEVNNSVYTVTTDYLNGYQYETKDVVYGGRGYAQLLFFPHAEGYVKAVYGIDVSEKKRLYKYVYNYLDRWNNIRISYTDDKGTLKVIQENNYYPFGLKQTNYNDTKKKLTLKSEYEGSLSKKVRTVPSIEGVYNYKYQKQERQNELGLNWDSFKWRNYDYAIGRFMSIDPLAEDYVYNSTYAFQENKMGMGVELEGLELSEFLKGMGGRLVDIAVGSNPIVQTVSQVQTTYTAAVQMNNGDVEGSRQTIINSTGIPALVDRVKAAASGDNKAQGSLAMDVLLILGTRKLAGKGTKTTSTTKSITAANGVEIKGFTKHGLNQKMNRNVKSSSVLDAVKKPLKIGDVKTDGVGRPSQRFTGAKAEVAVNPQSGKVVSTNPTSTKKAARLIKQQNQ